MEEERLPSNDNQTAAARSTQLLYLKLRCEAIHKDIAERMESDNSLELEELALFCALAQTGLEALTPPPSPQMLSESAALLRDVEKEAERVLQKKYDSTDAALDVFTVDEEKEKQPRQGKQERSIAFFNETTKKLDEAIQKMRENSENIKIFGMSLMNTSSLLEKAEVGVLDKVQIAIVELQLIELASILVDTSVRVAAVSRIQTIMQASLVKRQQLGRCASTPVQPLYESKIV